MEFYFAHTCTKSNVKLYAFTSQSLHLISYEYIYFTN